jgi:DeoR/GlpR family transcriptional regulator of sugar metabolism
MSQFERVYKIDRLLPGRVPPTKQRILEAIEVSEPTLRRDLEYMRSWLGASVTPDR